MNYLKQLVRQVANEKIFGSKKMRDGGPQVVLPSLILFRYSRDVTTLRSSLECLVQGRLHMRTLTHLPSLLPCHDRIFSFAGSISLIS
jgi:hypothetical protein